MNEFNPCSACGSINMIYNGICICCGSNVGEEKKKVEEALKNQPKSEICPKCNKVVFENEEGKFLCDHGQREINEKVRRERLTKNIAKKLMLSDY